jgi:hypothetical protein
MRRKHPDVEYEVDDASGRFARTFDTFDEAALYAVREALSHEVAHLNVLVYTSEGARFYGGDDAVDQYLEDPEASVFERFEIRANNLGRVP